MVSRRWSRVSGLSAGLIVASAAGAVSAAPSLVSSEDWQVTANNFGPSPARWRAVTSCNSDAVAGAAAPAITTDTTCSGNFARETLSWSAGRVISNKPVTVAVNDRYCVTAWVRIAPGVDPYIAINYTSDSTGTIGLGGDGYSITGRVKREHYLIAQDNTIDTQAAGGYGTLPASATVNTAVVNTWVRYKSTAFSVLPADVAMDTANLPTKYMVPRFVNFDGTGNCQVGAKAAMDVDDIRIWKLAGGDSCPDLDPVKETSHATCAGTTPICSSTATAVDALTENVFGCGKCDGNFADDAAAKPKKCATVGSPTCFGSGACGLCTEDNGASNPVGAAQCGSVASPFCKIDGTCAKCTKDADCADASKKHSGKACDLATGTCTSGCTVASEATLCGSNQFCVQPNAAAGTCQNKLENGTAIPSRTQDAAAGRGKCTVDNGKKFCASAVCDPTNDKCGLANGTACQVGDDAKCVAGVCDSDGKCGKSDGSDCTDKIECRIGACTNSKCGNPIPTECTDDTTCSGGKVCDTTAQKCVVGCHNGRGCNPDQTCSSSTATIGQCNTTVVPGVDAGQPTDDAGSTSSSSGGAATSGGCATTGNQNSANEFALGALGVLGLVGVLRRRRSN